MTTVKCDFCSERPVTARYVADSFVSQTMSGPGLIQESIGDWAACAICETLLDAGRWDLVTERATNTFFRNNPAMMLVMNHAELRASLEALYGELRAHHFRKGKLE